MRNIFIITLIFSLALFSACDDAETFDVREDALIDYKVEINVQGCATRRIFLKVIIASTTYD